MNACFEDLEESAPIREIVGATEFIRAVQTSPQSAYAFAMVLSVPAQEKLESLHISYPSELLVTASEYDTREEIVQQAISSAQIFRGMMEFDRVFSIGDGYWDLLTARKLDLDFILIAPDEQADRLRETDAQKVFPDFATKGWGGRKDVLLLHA